MFIKQFFLFLFTILIGHLNAGVIKKDLTEVENFHFCLITYLDSINLIHITQHSNLTTQTAKDPKICENFHAQLASTISIMYSVIRAALEQAFEDTEEANCLIDVFKNTRFMEYNVIATAAVQFHQNAFEELNEILKISKNIFIYATVRCLISEEMLFDIFKQLSSHINVKEDELQCIIKDVTQRKLINASDIFIYDIDEFFNAKFNTNDYMQVFTGHQKYDTNFNNGEESDFNKSEIYESTTEEIENEADSTTINYGNQITELYSENENYDSFTDKDSAEIEELITNNEEQTTEMEETKFAFENSQEYLFENILETEETFKNFPEITTVTGTTNLQETTTTSEEIKISMKPVNFFSNEEVITSTEISMNELKQFLSHDEEESTLKTDEYVEKFLISSKNLADISEKMNEIVVEAQKLSNDINKKYETTTENIESFTIFDDQEIDRPSETSTISVKLSNSIEKQLKIGEIEITTKKNSTKPLIEISDSRIKRNTQKCHNVLKNIEMRMKNFKIESINEELNLCISSKMTNENVDDMLVFIMLKKLGESELQVNIRNRKLMNIITRFVENFMDCTDLFGFWEMAGFSD